MAQNHPISTSFGQKRHNEKIHCYANDSHPINRDRHLRGEAVIVSVTVTVTSGKWRRIPMLDLVALPPEVPRSESTQANGP